MLYWPPSLPSHPMKVAVDERDLFDVSGPTYLSPPQWPDLSYKRALLACLVQSVYVMEKDRQLSLGGVVNAMAPKWWIPFNYRPIKMVHDEQHGEHVVGAVFKWNRRACLLRPTNAPKVVVAFRGTMPHGDTLRSDLTADVRLMLHQLHTTPRFTAALNEVKQAIVQYGVQNVTIVGHSLGAAVCMLAGRVIAEDGSNLETHLFNPPFASPPLERIKSHAWKMSLQVIRMAAVAVSAKVLLHDESKKQVYDAFMALRDWYPHLYVNINDPICSSYIGYFTSRQHMLGVGKGNLARHAAPFSLRALLQSMFGESPSYHLIPSAHLHVVEKSSKQFKKAHGMQQWWSPEIQIHYLEVGFDAKDYADRVDKEEQR